MTEHGSEHEHRVTPLELFFDLVFVFGFTQVTTLMSDDPSWSGLGKSPRSSSPCFSRSRSPSPH